MWTDESFAAAIPMYKSGVLSAKEVELLRIALDASFTHLYAPGTRRHIKAAPKAGAAMERSWRSSNFASLKGSKRVTWECRSSPTSWRGWKG
jgi:hypothetical protein